MRAAHGFKPGLLDVCSDFMAEAEVMEGRPERPMLQGVVVVTEVVAFTEVEIN